MEKMKPREKLNAIDNGLLVIIMMMDDPLLSPDRIPNRRHEAIKNELLKRGKADNVYIRMLLKLKQEIAKELLDESF